MIQLGEFIYDLVNIATGSVKAISYGAKTLHYLARKVPDEDIMKVTRLLENGGILLNGTTKKISVKKEDFPIFLNH